MHRVALCLQRVDSSDNLHRVRPARPPVQARVADCRCVLRRVNTALLESGCPVRVPVLRVRVHRDAGNLPSDLARLAETQTFWPRRHLPVATAVECRLDCNGHVWAAHSTTQAKEISCAGPWPPTPAPHLRLLLAGSPCRRRP